MIDIRNFNATVAEKLQELCGVEFASDEIAAFNQFEKGGTVFYGFADDEFICCWGVVPVTYLSNKAYLWLWVRPGLRRKLTLARHSRGVIAATLNRYPQLIGHCKSAALDSQRWLRWLGAEFGTPAQGLTPFEIRRV